MVRPDALTCLAIAITLTTIGLLVWATWPIIPVVALGIAAVVIIFFSVGLTGMWVQDSIKRLMAEQAPEKPEPFDEIA